MASVLVRTPRSALPEDDISLGAGDCGVGCIGAIGPIEMQQAVHAVALTLKELGIASGAPA